MRPRLEGHEATTRANDDRWPETADAGREADIADDGSVQHFWAEQIVGCEKYLAHSVLTGPTVPATRPSGRCVKKRQ